MQSEELQAFIEIEHLFGDLMQLEILTWLAVDIEHGHADILNIFFERLPDRLRDMQQSEEAWRIEAAAMSQASADHVVVLGCDLLQDVQQRNRRFEHVVSATHQSGSLTKLAFADPNAHAFQIED